MRPAGRPGRGRAAGRASRWHRALGVAAGLAAAALLASCGVPTSASPKVIPSSQVPYGLASPEGRSGTTPSSVPSEPVVTTIYLVDPDQLLTSATRQVVGPSPSLLATLEALLAAPDSTESKEGLSSALTSQVRVLSTAIRSDHVAVVNFNLSFTEIASAEQELAVAQVVWTATGVQGVTAVQFEIDGKLIGVPTDQNGAEVQRPVRRTDYAALAPGASTSGAGAAASTS